MAYTPYRPNFQRNFQRGPRINQFIKAPNLRVIDDTGKQLGVISLPEALKAAQERGLDLIEISPTADPPVAKIMDYGKWRYNQDKKEREKKQKSKAVENKAMRLSVNIGLHDLKIKAGQIDKFLQEGNIVSIQLRLKGREKAHKDFAEVKIKDLLAMLETAHKVIQPIKVMPNGIVTAIAKN